jgi:hypothetical protein
MYDLLAFNAGMTLRLLAVSGYERFVELKPEA